MRDEKHNELVLEIRNKSAGENLFRVQARVVRLICRLVKFLLSHMWKICLVGDNHTELHNRELFFLTVLTNSLLLLVTLRFVF